MSTDTSVAGVQRATRHVDRYLAQHIGGRIAGYMILIVLTLTSMFPLIWMVTTSLRERSEVFKGGLLPTQVTFDAYTFLLDEVHILTYFGNSVLITSITVLVVVTLATLAGYAFAHLDFWGKEIVFIILLGTLMVPGTC